MCGLVCVCVCAHASMSGFCACICGLVCICFCIYLGICFQLYICKCCSYLFLYIMYYIRGGGSHYNRNAIQLSITAPRLIPPAFPRNNLLWVGDPFSTYGVIRLTLLNSLTPLSNVFVTLYFWVMFFFLFLPMIFLIVICNERIVND